MKYKIRTRTFQAVHEPTTNFGHATGPEHAVPLIKAILRDACDADREHFIVLALDARLQIIGYKIISVGTLTQCLVHPKEVFKVAITFSAASLLVAHSHPSQIPIPSEDDRLLTERLIEAGKLLGIPLVDHLVLPSSGHADSGYVSIMHDQLVFPT